MHGKPSATRLTGHVDAARQESLAVEAWRKLAQAGASPPARLLLVGYSAGVAVATAFGMLALAAGYEVVGFVADAGVPGGVTLPVPVAPLSMRPCCAAAVTASGA